MIINSQQLEVVLMWVLFSIFVGVALAIDLGVIGKIKEMRTKRSDQKAVSKEKKVRSTNDALAWTIVWISLGLIFAGVIYFSMGYEKMLEYITGYTLEKTLSVDNMFVFLLIFTSLAIPHHYQHKVLSVGILSAIAMRIPLVIAGVSLLETFHWMIYVFGAFLIFTAIRMFVQKKEEKIELEKNIAVRALKKIMPVDVEIKTDKFLLRKNGILYATPLLVAIAIVEMTDLVFALDSIPAVLAITSDPFIVITSNVFAIFGLRSLYFLLSGSMEKFFYLKPALTALLFFIGFKMLLSEFYEIPIEMSLAIICSILGIAIALSYVKTRAENQQRTPSRDRIG
ncbi:MAG: TerC/Alx family metal homeostasis membrane protein [Thermoproteota archaeon]|nr:TerC/Alx family metal homeostasis membrane protein [Thermoproteota archaeon]